MNSMKDFINVQCVHHLLCVIHQVSSLAPHKHTAAYLAITVSSAVVILFEVICICRKRGDINQVPHIFLEKKIARG